MSRYRVWVSGFVIEVDDIPQLTDVTGDQPAQLEGLTTRQMLDHLRADEHTTIHIDYADPEVDGVWHNIAMKRGLGGWI